MPPASANASESVRIAPPRKPRLAERLLIPPLAAGIDVLPVLPFAAGASRHVTLRSWDQMQLPLPGARVRVRLGAPLAVPADASDAQLETYRLELETRLTRLTAEVDGDRGAPRAAARVR